jgi:hypothetical protein
MKVRAKAVARRYEFTDAKVKAKAKSVIRDSKPYIEILTDDDD